MAGGGERFPRVKDLMKGMVEYVSPDDSLPAVANKFKETNSGLLFLMEGGKLSGVVTDRDLVVRGGQNFQNLRARDVCTKIVASVAPESGMDAAADVMRRERVRRVPVVSEDGRPCGLLSISDIARRDAKLAADVLVDITQPMGPHDQSKEGPKV
jgi:CBS domain-containing protein